jgi:hypothetical protein
MMPAMTSLARSFAALALLASGCGVNSYLNRIENEGDKTVDIVCDCTNVFPDRAACEDMFGSYLSFFDRDCLEDALAEDKDASKESLKCTLDKAKEYNSCLEDKLNCSDPNSFQSCTSIFENECPELPVAVQTKLSACSTATD